MDKSSLIGCLDYNQISIRFRGEGTLNLPQLELEYSVESG